MDERKQRNLTLIEQTETEVEQVSKPSVTRHTNPIMKKALEFHQENKGKFRVKDLFKP